MSASIVYLKYLLESGNLTANIYNDHIVTAVQTGLIKDVTPREYPMDKFQVVGAIIEFPDSQRFDIKIYNPPDILNPDNRYNYKVEVRKVLVSNVR